jgi:putative DNA-invertase from lambdoid prophage Rac
LLHNYVRQRFCQRAVKSISPAGCFTILSAVAEAERDRIRERVAQLKQDQKGRGRYLGGKVPFGYRVADDGALVSDDAQQDAIQVAHRMRAEGATMRAMLAALAKNGHHLSLGAVHRVLHDTPGTTE